MLRHIKLRFIDLGKYIQFYEINDQKTTAIKSNRASCK